MATFLKRLRSSALAGKPMKNVKLLVLLLTVGISACKKEESKPDVKVSIIGKWQLEHYVEVNYKNGVKQDESTRFDEKVILEFKNDKDVVFDGTDYIYQMEGNKRLKLMDDQQAEPEFDFEITKISDTELTLFLERTTTRKNGDVLKVTDELFFKK
jgi:hypothetical protein